MNESRQLYGEMLGESEKIEDYLTQLYTHRRTELPEKSHYHFQVQPRLDALTGGISRIAEKVRKNINILMEDFVLISDRRIEVVCEVISQIFEKILEPEIPVIEKEGQREDSTDAWVPYDLGAKTLEYMGVSRKKINNLLSSIDLSSLQEFGDLDITPMEYDLLKEGENIEFLRYRLDSNPKIKRLLESENIDEILDGSDSQDNLISRLEQLAVQKVIDLGSKPNEYIVEASLLSNVIQFFEEVRLILNNIEQIVEQGKEELGSSDKIAEEDDNEMIEEAQEPESLSLEEVRNLLGLIKSIENEISLLEGKVEVNLAEIRELDKRIEEIDEKNSKLYYDVDTYKEFIEETLSKIYTALEGDRFEESQNLHSELIGYAKEVKSIEIKLEPAEQAKHEANEMKNLYIEENHQTYEKIEELRQEISKYRNPLDQSKWEDYELSNLKTRIYKILKGKSRNRPKVIQTICDAYKDSVQKSGNLIFRSDSCIKSKIRELRKGVENEIRGGGQSESNRTLHVNSVRHKDNSSFETNRWNEEHLEEFKKLIQKKKKTNKRKRVVVGLACKEFKVYLSSKRAKNMYSKTQIYSKAEELYESTQNK